MSLSLYPQHYASQAVVPLTSFRDCPEFDRFGYLSVARQFHPDAFSVGGFSMNAVSPASGDSFAILDRLEELRSCHGKFHFRLYWRELGYFNDWLQTSNPTTSSTVTGYEAVDIKFGNEFAGLYLGDTYSVKGFAEKLE